MAEDSIAHDNHYVPVWYQKRFLAPGQQLLHRLDLNPLTYPVPGGGPPKRARELVRKHPTACFFEHDLYTTWSGGEPNDEVERYLFGRIDDDGAKAVRAFAEDDKQEMHRRFKRFFEFMSVQKLRTPKGLDWIRSRYPALTQVDLMVELQQLRAMHCTMWFECVREIVSAEDSEVKFIVTDHPVTTYNSACPPDSSFCAYPDDPSIAWVGTQTLFALDANRCLILTNLEYAKDPSGADLMARRVNARFVGQTLARTDTMIRTRKLRASEVVAVNHVLKVRAHRYIAAGQESWLPREAEPSWRESGEVLLPPSDELWGFSGEMYVGHKDGSTYHQDAFGQSSPGQEHLRKKPDESLGPNDPCGCSSGRRFKKCCKTVSPFDRPTWEFRSIRERAIGLESAVGDILGFNQGKSWLDVRRELSDEQVRRIHEAVQVLWPKETDLLRLLPRPDNRVCRAVYMGLLDPRTVFESVTAWLTYFDEIVLLHPFQNANFIRPEYSPVASPGQYKSQTLKDVLLLLRVMPFVRAGLVHLIPDPAMVDFAFLHMAMDMAKERGSRWRPSPDDMRKEQALGREDGRRAILRAREDILRHKVFETNPGISIEEVDGVMREMKRQLEEDPLALLQPLADNKQQAEMMVVRGVSLEVALFLAQSTGACIYTDSPAHWKQLHLHTRASEHLEEHPDVLMKAINAVDFVTENDPEMIMGYRASGELRYFRRWFRRVGLASQAAPLDAQRVSDLASRLGGVAQRAAADWRRLGDAPWQTDQVSSKMQMSLPAVGFASNTVHRLLLMFGRGDYPRRVSMALFIEPVERVADDSI